MSEIPEELAPYFSIEETIVYPIANLSGTFFIYGLYVLLFGTYIYTLRNRQQRNEAKENLYVWLTVVLFGLSTTFVVAYTIGMVMGSLVRFNTVKTHDYEAFVDYMTHNVGNIAVFALQMLLHVLLNIAVDYMLIHRCYVIWGSKKRIACPAIVTSVLTNILGLVSSIMMAIGFSDLSIQANRMLYNAGNNLASIYYICSTIVNTLLTLFTAGRIWWIHRQVRAHGSVSSDTFVHSVFRIILESGIIYPIFTIAALVTSNTVATARVDLSPFIVLSAGIAPTLIMVRAKLGKNVENLQDQVSTIDFASRSAPQERVGAQVDSITNLGIVVLEMSNKERLDRLE